MHNTTPNTDLTYGFDPGSPDGDVNAISIQVGSRLHTFVGEQAKAVMQLITQAERRGELKGRIDTAQRIIKERDGSITMATHKGFVTVAGFLDEAAHELNPCEPNCPCIQGESSNE